MIPVSYWMSEQKTYFYVDVYEILYGIPNEDENILLRHLNYIILLGKYHIYKCKKVAKELDLFEFLLDCKKDLINKKEFYFYKGYKDFDKTWGPLLNML